MSNQKNPEKKVRSTMSFQDELFEIFQIFWKAGYAYRHNKEENSHLFLMDIAEDLSMLPREEFVAKYKFFDNTH